jgi:DMSO/TMAO reductase YedYZ molybdopterin-dependent catalytic subunit
MLKRFVSMVLLVVMGILFLTGIAMLYGTWSAWIFDLHRIMGFALVAVLPWKSIVVYRSLRRRVKNNDPWPSTIPSLPMTPLLIVVVALGLMWVWRLGPYQTLMAQTVIAWHWILGLIMIPFFVAHVLLRWPQPRPTDFASRRGAVKLLGLGAAGVVGWLLSVALARFRATEERPRRSITGSRGFGRFTGNDFPIVGEHTISVDVEQWRLTIDGAVEEPLTLTYDGMLSLSAERMNETIDCTSGWYSLQEWSGVPLVRLLEETGGLDGAGVRLVSATEYNHTYPMAEARTILLATHVTGEVLAAQHGYPLRAVVPDRRGWFWVKWLTHVEVLDSQAEVLGGILSAARQILRQF